MVGLESGIVAQADPHGLAAAIHGNEVDVHVDQEVGLRGAPVDAHALAVVRDAQLHHPVRGLTVMVVEAVGVILAEDLPSHGAPDFERRHPPVVGGRNDDVNILDAFFGQPLEEDRQDGLADVRPGHLRQGQRDIVNGDGDFHSRPEQGCERLHFFRMGEGVVDGRCAVRKAGDRRVRIHDAGPGRHLHREEVFSEPHQAGSRILFEVDHAALVRDQGFSPHGIRGRVSELKLPRARCRGPLGKRGHGHLFSNP